MSQSLYTLRYDMTWNAIMVWIWLTIECDLAIICISVPILRILLRRLVPKLWPGGTTTTKSLPGHTSSFQTHPAKGQQSMTSLIHDGRILKTDVIEMHSRAANDPGSLPSSRGYDTPYDSGRSRPFDSYSRQGNYPIGRAV
jgi:hypothetical protein